MQTWLYKNWWVLAINGVIAVLFGIMTIRVPLDVIQKFILFFGLLILLSGIVLIIVSLFNLKKKKSWIIWLLEGIFNTAVGILIISNREITLDLFLVFFGIWALVLGVLQGIIILNMKQEQPGKQLLFINFILCVALGIMLFYNPLKEPSTFLKVVSGIVAFVAGILVIVNSFILKSGAKKQIIPTEEEKEEEKQEDLQETGGSESLSS